jgi:hypothetical protein
MDKVAALPAAQRSELFAETAARRGTTPAIAEKNFWVTWTLGKLFSHPDLPRILMFKGGTSLSNVFGLIERFSEDIDLILDWRILTGKDPEAASQAYSAKASASFTKIFHQQVVPKQMQNGSKANGALQLPGYNPGYSTNEKGPAHRASPCFYW